jgi:leucyl aminopeptidase
MPTVAGRTQLAAMHAGDPVCRQGSHTPARMIVLEYNPVCAASDPDVLVGQGQHQHTEVIR